MTEVPPEPGKVPDLDLGIPGPAEPLPDNELDEPTSDDYEEAVEDDG